MRHFTPFGHYLAQLDEAADALQKLLDAAGGGDRPAGFRARADRAGLLDLLDEVNTMRRVLPASLPLCPEDRAYLDKKLEVFQQGMKSFDTVGGEALDAVEQPAADTKSTAVDKGMDQVQPPPRGPIPPRQRRPRLTTRIRPVVRTTADTPVGQHGPSDKSSGCPAD
jgi:hypothetical protein